MELPGYQLIGRIAENEETILYRLKSLRDQSVVMCQTTRDAYPPADAMGRYEHEFEMLRLLGGRGAVRPLELKHDGNRPYLLLEDFGGTPMQQLFNKGQGGKDVRPLEELGLLRLLGVAADTADCLARVHHRQIIHNAINPFHILIHPDTLEVRLLGFQTAYLAESPPSTAAGPNLDQSCLAYIAPEQTGRFNRQSGYHSDVYSLGVTLYEWLTGHPPFTAKNATELIYSHIANQAPSVSAQEAAIPWAVSDIIRQCMEKAPEERYGTASDVHKDLSECLVQLKEKGIVMPFALPPKNTAGVWSIPQHIYGREAEQRRLKQILDLTADEPADIVLVGGQAGMGKTALVWDALGHIGSHGLLLAGKFELHSANIPYFAWIQVIEDLVTQLIIQHKDDLELWRLRIQEQVGEYGQLLINWMPKLRALIGEPAQVQPLPLMEEKSRFHQILRSFIQLFSDANYSLTIFLDDMQWADEASLQLIEQLFSRRRGSMRLVCTYREGEQAITPWGKWEPEANMTLVAITRVALLPLREEAVEQLLADTLRASADSLQELTEVLTEKTGGNPLLLRTLLQNGADQGMFSYNRLTRSWKWDMTRIREMESPLQSLGQWSAGRLAALPQASLELLAWAAFLGRRFELSMLQELCGNSREGAISALMEAVRHGVLQVDRRENARATLFAFPHDRIRQDCHALVPESSRGDYHYAVGQLWKQRAVSDTDPAIFEAVIHLNQCKPQIVEWEEKLELARLNDQAGWKSLQSTAWEQALRYSREAAQLIGEEGWERCFDLTFRVLSRQAMCELLCGEDEVAYRLFDILLVKAATDMDRVEIYITMIQLESNRGHNAKALQLADEALLMLGIKLPKKVSMTRLLAQWIRLKWRLRGRHRNRIRELPAMKDRRLLAIMSIFNYSGNARFTRDANVWAFSNLMMVDLTLRHGLAPDSSASFAGVALISTLAERNYRDGYEWGKLAYELSEAHPAMRSIQSNVFSLCFDSWRRHEPSLLEAFIQHAEHASLESASLWHAEQSVLFTCALMFLFGRPLGEIYTLLIRNAQFLSNSRDLSHSRLAAILSAILSKLIGERNLEDLFTEVDILAPDFVLNEEWERNTVLEESVCMFGYITAYIFGQYEMAYSYILRAKAVTSSREEKEIEMSALGLYHFLVMAELYPIVTDTERKSFLDVMRSSLRKIKRYAKRCPENYENKYLMMAAELARITGKAKQAASLYEKACDSAREGGYTHNLAIVSENAFRFYIDQDKPHLARAYLSQAYQAYIQWGALEKASQLLKQYRHMLFIDQSSLSGSIDYQAVMSSAQTISGEMRMDRLLVGLMRTLMQNAGAEKGALIFQTKDQLFIEAMASSGTDVRLERVRLDQAGDVPAAIISYAARTGEVVVLNHASREGVFASLPYVQEKQMKSVLCIPMIKNSRMISLLYLENNLSAGVFTPERLDVLKVLCSQCVISIENAQLYSNAERLKQTLEEQVKERTRSLELSIRETASALAEASIQLDRNRIAADVHDIVGHAITSTLLQIEAAKRQMQNKPEDALQRLQGVQNLLREGLNQIRGSIHMLKEAEGDNLVKSLQQLIAITEHNAGITVKAEIDPLFELDRVYHHVIYHALQEGMTNAIRHGDATIFHFVLRDEGQHLQFMLQDNGRGAEQVTPGFGLTAMTERVEALNGRLSIESSKDTGFLLRITLPYTNSKEKQYYAEQ
ncbi:AAA family ATPase [Paenibacillus sp. GCM10012307]|uniref:AAA family ATPase n=1 Tax=Paenibacillus roseus TaxID=2798579 RepID=A0A934J7T4_9BACL|nr:AAA family ATPase [Paenibacillus roseus]MBJ6361987.1 AAA family ATPase [Paenibacillus roseus]